MPNNTNSLSNAQYEKKDEFYTEITDIEKELVLYRSFFKGKKVFCNCDDPYESNFFKFFALNFNSLELKKLTATCYDQSPFVGTQLDLFQTQKDNNKKAFKIEISSVDDSNGDGAVDLTDVQYLLRNKKNALTILQSNGDFRSEECIELLKDSDIVVTNPPFSLFREYVKQLIQYKKSFIILGNINAISYKEIFPLIQSNALWLGQSIHSGDREFMVPDDYPLKAVNCRVGDDGRKYIRVKGVRWFTNVDTPQRHEQMFLFKKYKGHEKDYPTYDNYDGIEVSETTDIPCDYKGMMGVPITFLDKYDPDQFEILGITDRQNVSGLRTKTYTAEDSTSYNDLNRRAALLVDGKLVSTYARILIKNKHPEED
jgi:hypothetical protein